MIKVLLATVTADEVCTVVTTFIPQKRPIHLYVDSVYLYSCRSAYVSGHPIPAKIASASGRNSFIAGSANK